MARQGGMRAELGEARNENLAHGRGHDGRPGDARNKEERLRRVASAPSLRHRKMTNAASTQIYVSNA